MISIVWPSLQNYERQAPLGGYMDIQILLRFGGVLCELQITTVRQHAAKGEGGGHARYVLRRWLSENILLAAMERDTCRLKRILEASEKLRFPLKDLAMAVCDKNGHSALHYAAFSSTCLDMVQVLLDKCSANPLQETTPGPAWASKGQTAVELASLSNRRLQSRCCVSFGCPHRKAPTHSCYARGTGPCIAAPAWTNVKVPQ